MSFKSTVKTEKAVAAPLAVSTPLKEIDIERLIPSDSKFKSYYKTYFLKNGEKKKNRYVQGKRISDKEGRMTIRHQVSFIMDVTGSMQSYIDGTKQQIHAFIKTLNEAAKKEVTKNFPDKSDEIDFIFEVAVVAYRDFLDIWHFETLDFTSDLEQVTSFLDSLHAKGGDDQPEDVEGALIHALFGIDQVSKKLSWNDHGEVASRIMIWLADSPPHGLKLNGLQAIGDNYPEVDLNEWNELVKEMANLKVNFISTKLTNDNDITNVELSKICNSNGVKYDTVDITQSVNFRKFNSEAGYARVAECATAYCSKSTREYISSKKE